MTYNERVRLRSTHLIALLFLAASAPSMARNGGELREISVSIQNVRPTQQRIGINPEDESRGWISRQLTRAGTAFAPAPQAVIGPGGQVYLIDGHHRVRSLYEAGQKNITLRVRDDLSSMSEPQFWKTMKEKGWVYLSAPGGGEISPSLLPRTIGQLEYDPYRKLATLLRRAGAFESLDVPFQEFFWADYLRERIELPAGGRPTAEWYQSAFSRAMEISREPQAARLPGFSSIAIPPASCKDRLLRFWLKLGT